MTKQKGKLVEWKVSPLSTTQWRQITPDNWRQQQGFEGPDLYWQRQQVVGLPPDTKPYAAPEMPHQRFANPVVYVEEWNDRLEQYFAGDPDFEVHDVTEPDKDDQGTDTTEVEGKHEPVNENEAGRRGGRRSSSK